MKRILNCRASDFQRQPDAAALVAAIRASEGRVVLAEVAAETPPLYPDVTNAELVAAFGADMVLLKGYNTATHAVAGAPGAGGVEQVKALTGRLVGVSLEVTPENDADNPRSLSRHALEQVQGADFLCLTGYDKPGVDRLSMLQAISLAKAHFPGFIMVAKFSARGLMAAAEYAEYATAGAHAVVIPAPGTCQGSREGEVSAIVDAVHLAGALAITTISTSQEGADGATVSQIGLASKRCGSDIHSFGDAGCAGIADPEAIYRLSIAVRGKRHTWVRMASSIMR
ncbi:haloacid dehalogenase-like hydrolase [Bacillus amyloliquefaciens]|nr:haloacid dehalogenase-like hydrolase [Bacillus amyloliquefaciens]